MKILLYGPPGVGKTSIADMVADELAGTRFAVEEFNGSYVSRVLRLTLLAPDIVEAILDGQQPPQLTLAVLLEPFPLGWTEQDQAFLPG